MSHQYMKLTVTRGNELAMSAEFRAPEEGYKTHFYIMEDISDPDSVLVEKHTGDGIDQFANIAKWIVDDADVAVLLENYYDYAWRVEYEDAIGNRTQVNAGSLTVIGGLA